ncbi:NADH:ubiquinone reductase (Na(+)-transporting) subunit B [Sediminitomix flava]|uniref:Na(+)-translocating NADH-quinone reductase subunit B n=1 Tax=Sediminitomix flava TaxID=379075 RepID=A0A315ZBB9_SEDFL|nr:NADH:ubiquinone reductase (Na(+)-transporting) subunit B [Sediminitomix flava]PWJ42841.1 Na+-transporting NADH:ubiquinone oxidoreductase subunit B [Sediminitomix flava]
MKFLYEFFEKNRPSKDSLMYYPYEAGETFMFTPKTVTGSKGAHVRDAIDLKRMMMTVIIAMIPALLFGIYNVGEMHAVATGAEMGFGDKVLFGAIRVIPIIIAAYAGGGLVEVVFGALRKHPINEGLLVTGMLIPLVVPASIPLWQVFVASAFAVLIGKEVFGGTGMNILNVALTARAFLYFAYPAQISGDKVWFDLADATAVDGFTGATFLGLASSASSEGIEVAKYAAEATASWSAGLYSAENLFFGFIPGSIGETSTLAVLLGALILVGTRVGSGRIILATVLGAMGMGLIMNAFGANTYMQMPAYYHLIAGGFAFGAVFMATDPVTAAQTDTGKWIYGALIGILTVIIRVWNPAYPEGIMLAILLMNVLAPLVDYYVVEANKKRRLKRATV